MIGVTYSKKFHIKQNSTLPLIKYPLTQRVLEMNGISEDMLKGIGVTFSMFEVGTGNYIIANSQASIVLSDDRVSNPYDEKYTLTYRFKEEETSKTGFYGGEFVIDFLGYDNCGKIKLPLSGYVDIIISNSITKTTLI